jgi:thiol-disulfide isomerase/thioredoxin
MAALAPFSSPASADEPNPVTLNMRAPELVGREWRNTPGNAPLTLAGERGKVTILHFWTFACINCKDNVPSYRRWQKQFAGQKVAIIGVHTPESPWERKVANVIREIHRQGINYPVLLDPKGVNWDRWGQHYWPTIYLIDKHGRVRYRWAGELEYERAGGEAAMARLVNQLLMEG